MVKGLGSVLLACAAVASTFAQTPQARPSFEVASIKPYEQQYYSYEYTPGGGFRATLPVEWLIAIAYDKASALGAVGASWAGRGPQAPRQVPSFEVVSIRQSAPDQPGAFPQAIFDQRPDGGISVTNHTVASLIARAYPPTLPVEIIGLPDWARRDRYNVNATARVSSATRDDQLAMLRSMLEDRFKLAVHVEAREQAAYDLVLARRDGKLGSGLTSVNVSCPAVPNASTEKPPLSPQMPDFKAAPPSCTFRTVGAVLRDRLGDGQGKLGDLLEGEGTMAALAESLRAWVDRPVVDKTGLPGTYRVGMNFDMFARLKGPSVEPSPSAIPSVFAAVEQQLGLKLEPSRQLRDTLVVDRLERPTEN